MKRNTIIEGGVVIYPEDSGKPLFETQVVPMTDWPGTCESCGFPQGWRTGMIRTYQWKGTDWDFCDDCMKSPDWYGEVIRLAPGTSDNPFNPADIG